MTQFVTLAKTWGYSRMDFVYEVSGSRKAIYLNFLFWSQHDFRPFGIEAQQKVAILEQVKKVWRSNNSKVPLPSA